MQPCRVELGLQPLPDCDRDILRGGKLAGELRDFLIEMAMVEVVEDLTVQNVLQQLEIDDKSSNRIDLASDRDFQV